MILYQLLNQVRSLLIIQIKTGLLIYLSTLV